MIVLTPIQFHSDDQSGVVVWGLIAPDEVLKLTEDDMMGVQFFDQKTFFDPTFLEKRVKITYGIQKLGQTIVIPSGWAYFMVRIGRGLSFSASWNTLRLRHIVEARQSVEFNRSLGIYKPVNLSSLLVSCAYQRLDELEAAEANDKHDIAEFLFRILPVLKVIALEELLGENLSISSIVTLGYDSIIDRLRKNGRTRLPNHTMNELAQIRPYPLPGLENDAVEDDEDALFACCSCKYILFNTRRSCPQCKGYDLCEVCYHASGNSHPHRLRKLRKMAVSNLLDLVDNIMTVTYDKEEIGTSIYIPATPAVIPAPAVEKESKEVRELKELASPGKPMELRTEISGRESRSEAKRKRREAIKQDLSPEIRQENYDQEVIDCICGNNKDLGFMISCEKCYAWLHGKCVGISKRNEPEEYYCPRCVKKMGALNAAAKLNPKSFSPERKLREYKLA